MESGLLLAFLGFLASALVLAVVEASEHVLTWALLVRVKLDFLAWLSWRLFFRVIDAVPAWGLEFANLEATFLRR